MFDWVLNMPMLRAVNGNIQARSSPTYFFFKKIVLKDFAKPNENIRAK